MLKSLVFCFFLCLTSNYFAQTVTYIDTITSADLSMKSLSTLQLMFSFEKQNNNSFIFTEHQYFTTKSKVSQYIFSSTSDSLFSKKILGEYNSIARTFFTSNDQLYILKTAKSNNKYTQANFEELDTQSGLSVKKSVGLIEKKITPYKGSFIYSKMKINDRTTLLISYLIKSKSSDKLELVYFVLDNEQEKPVKKVISNFPENWSDFSLNEVTVNEQGELLYILKNEGESHDFYGCRISDEEIYFLHNEGVDDTQFATISDYQSNTSDVVSQLNFNKQNLDFQLVTYKELDDEMILIDDLTIPADIWLNGRSIEDMEKIKSMNFKKKTLSFSISENLSYNLPDTYETRFIQVLFNDERTGAFSARILIRIHPDGTVELVNAAVPELPNTNDFEKSILTVNERGETFLFFNDYRFYYDKNGVYDLDLDEVRERAKEYGSAQIAATMNISADGEKVTRRLLNSGVSKNERILFFVGVLEDGDPLIVTTKITKQGEYDKSSPLLLGLINANE